MPSKRITDAFVRNVKLPAKDDRENQVTYIDTMERGLALVLVVSYGGTRTFRVMTYRNGKPQSRKLGTYPQLKVKDARAAAREYWQSPEKFEAKAGVGSFKEVAENWLKRHVETNKLRSRSEIERILKKYVYPEWKDRPFLEVRRSDANALLDRVADDHGLSQADAVLAIIRGVMTWHQSRDENYTSPIVKGMRRNKNGKARDRILNDDEIRAVWTAAEGTFGALLKTALMTAQRREKVATMRWDDIDDDGWTIQTDEREKGTAGSLKLPKPACDIIHSQPRIAGNPFVFAGRGGGHLNSFSQRKAELDGALPAMPPWTIHDLRRTARSLMSRAGVRPDIAERVLGHAIPGIEGVYDRHRYDDEKADALKRLAALIERIVDLPQDAVHPKMTCAANPA
jgi:integrase